VGAQTSGEQGQWEAMRHIHEVGLGGKTIEWKADARQTRHTKRGGSPRSMSEAGPKN
jgi:hypothetical protein